MKPIKAYAVVLPGTKRITSSSLAYCPDGKEDNQCLMYDLFERKTAAIEAAKVYPVIHRKVIPVLISPIKSPKRK